MKFDDIDTLITYFSNDSSFELLMQRRIYRILLICSKYDAFMLEEDGRIDEQIFNEYVSLNLKHPPFIIKAHNETEAFKKLSENDIDLVITMLNIGKGSAFTLANRIKTHYNNIPIVVLTHFSREVSMQLEKEDLSAIDYVFSWLGNTDILLAIIKLLEDRMNADHDIAEVGVQTILLVEDSVRFYSSYLPNIYKIIFSQSQEFMTEGVNAHQKMIRMRGRPKILLATTYEEAIELYRKYKHNLLGVISDISYKKEGIKDPNAGFELYHEIRSENKFIPFLLQSSDYKNAEKAQKTGADFLYKNSSNLPYELRKYLKRSLAFGDFVFRNPYTKTVVSRASNLIEFQKCIMEASDTIIEYYARKNSFSRWLNARALFSIAEILQPSKVEDFTSIKEMKEYINTVITAYRTAKGRGVIAKFNKDNLDEYLVFARIGNGSIGGKARGLAFIDHIIKNHNLRKKYDNVQITIPQSVVLSTEIFDEFMEKNDLYSIAFNSVYSDQEILERFIDAELPISILKDLTALVDKIKKPLAIRSSSMLEDSHYQPFAGVYSTFMVPFRKNKRQMLHQVINAIKSVYASVYYHDSKAYMQTTSNSIDEEKMGVIIQELCGDFIDEYYMPTLSGVARSVNFYPIEPERYEDGIVSIAFGLGKTIVDGGASLRFSPKHPNRIIQFSSANETLKNSQKFFYALDCDKDFAPSIDEGVNLKKINFRSIKDKKILKYIASTYVFNDDTIRHGIIHDGKRIITFNYLLNNKTFPLPGILSNLLEVSQEEMNNPVEMEFACNIQEKNGKPTMTFYVLQIRPIVETTDYEIININKTDTDKALIYSEKALGNGKIENIRHIVYIKPESFDASKSVYLAELIDKINDTFKKQDQNYILIGPGRWGSSDPWLGVPVKWSQISQARLIIESGLENFRVDPSQGTHFFQNLTSFKIGYFTVNQYINDGFIKFNEIDKNQIIKENEYIKIVKFDRDLKILIDGKNKTGVVL
jgi:DNA-binding NarL/FixJ family response regulator